jgi:hypothetical protein
MDLLRSASDSPAGNIVVIQAGSVREWILAADHVISSHSTTLIEAALAGKPIHLYSPEPFPEALAAEWHGLVPVLENRDDFLQAVRQSPVEPTGTRLATWARAQFLGNDPLDTIVGMIARLHQAMGSGERTSLPDYRRLWNGRIMFEVALKWRRNFRLALARSIAQLHHAMAPRERMLWNGWVMVKVALEWRRRFFMPDVSWKRWRGSNVFGAHDVARRVWRWQHVFNNSIPGDLTSSTASAKSDKPCPSQETTTARLTTPNRSDEHLGSPGHA